jgi:prepilin peptidase CpaA
MQALVQLLLAIAAAVLVVAALHDLAVRAIPNQLITAVTAVGLALALLQHKLVASLAVAALVLLAAVALWLRGYFGGADAKLLAASGLLVPPVAVVPMLLATALAGGVLCIPYLLGPRLLPRPRPGRPTRLLPRLLRCELWRLRRGGPLPYAVAIAAGTLFAMHGA